MALVTLYLLKGSDTGELFAVLGSDPVTNLNFHQNKMTQPSRSSADLAPRCVIAITISGIHTINILEGATSYGSSQILSPFSTCVLDNYLGMF